jgi:hypothetical protein
MKPQAGNSPQQSAQIELANQTARQASLANAVGGRRRKRRRGRSFNRKGGSGIAAPQMLTPYPVAGAGDQNPNAIMKNNAIQENQGGANAVYDNSARTMKGGVKWGCYSGGTSTKRRKRRACSSKRRRQSRKRF